jgi:hypothetical protein
METALGLERAALDDLQETKGESKVLTKIEEAEELLKSFRKALKSR